MSTARNPLMAALSVLMGAVVLGLPAAAADDVAGTQGTDTSLPSTDSEVTVSGRGPFADLEVTVNQTKNLTNQAVSIVWEGGAPTLRNGRTSFAGNFLQIMQCWGDDDGTNADNPGPPPEQCVAGATTAVYEGRSGEGLPANNATRRQIGLVGDDGYDSLDGYRDSGGNVWREFRAVDGTVVERHVNDDFDPGDPGASGGYWTNRFFDINTTNEVAAVATSEDGTGGELFQVATGVQMNALGCGQRVQQTAGGNLDIPQCWIVVVPRGTPEYENDGTLWESGAAERGVSTSPLSDRAWANRIAIPIEFNPVDSPCELGVTERRIAGNELVAPVVSNWSPALCTNGGPPYSYAPVNDATARRVLTSRLPGAAGMVAISRPLPAESLSASNPVVYAPLAASGVAIGFNVERIPTLTASPKGFSLNGVRIERINLTPRLVAKLLTQSYRAQTEIVVPPDYEWRELNPAALHLDPDFVQFNPEFQQLQVADARLFSGLQLPAGTSDAARQVWEWVLADPEAAAWLAGEPDEWGMRVNPHYATVADANPFGVAFGSPTPESFPKADPYCYSAPPRSGFTPPTLCSADWMPYASSLDATASRVRIASDSARIAPNQFAQTPDAAWSRVSPQIPGRRAILAVTDTASAARYGLQMASLSRAGDNGADREFISPTDSALSLGLAAMSPASDAQFLEPDATADAPGAYPLTAITYAAAMPLSLDQVAREEYAAFLDYAAGTGQEPGLELGQLPRGYVPLLAALVAQTRAASETIRQLQPSSSATPVPGSTSDPGQQTPTAGLDPAAGGSSTAATSRSRTGSGAAAAATQAPADETSSETAATEGDSVESSSDANEPTASTAVTPSTEAGPGRVVVPVTAGLMVGSALGALELTKRPRRGRSGVPLQDSGPTHEGAVLA